MVGRVQLAQGDRNLMDVHVPSLPVELAKLVFHIGKGGMVIRRPIHERDCWH